MIIECGRVDGHIWQRYGRWMTERAASKQGEALAALREGSKVVGPWALGQNDDDQRREASLERRENVGSHRIRTATDIGYLCGCDGPKVILYGGMTATNSKTCSVLSADIVRC